MTSPDWKLPVGVSRQLWEYVNDPAVARGYDAYLDGSTLVQIDQQFAETHFLQPGQLVDLGCGTGRLSLAFARREFTVISVDLSEEMLRIVQERAQAAGVPIVPAKANLVQLEALADQSFDYAACLFSTLGMIDGPDNRRRALGQAYRLLRPGGRLVLHVHNRWFNFWSRSGRRWLLTDLRRALTRRPDRGDWAMPAHQGLSGLTLHLFSRREILHLLKRVGFHVLEMRPVGLRSDGRLPWPGWFGGLRAIGYLIAAERP